MNLFIHVRCTNSSYQTLLFLEKWRDDILKVSRYRNQSVLHFCWNFFICIQLLNTCISLNSRIFQDCKDFQGELFGICNLFRDLSDKLFTSEIFELHEKQGQREGDCHGREQESTKITCVKEVGVTSSSMSETTDSEKALASQPVLKDVGKYDHVFYYSLYAFVSLPYIL